MLNDSELEKLRKAGRIAGEALQLGMGLVSDGVKLFDVATEVESYIISHGAKPAFPCNLGINEVAAHYTPKPNDKLRFDVGDVVKVDVGAQIDGFVGDTAGTVEVSTKTFRKMIDASRKARDAVMEFIGDGCPMNQIGKMVDTTIRSDGFVPIRNLMGHQIKQYNLHSGLSVPNIDDGNITVAESGMVLAVEPFATNGKGEIVSGPQGNIFKVSAPDKAISDTQLNDFFSMIKDQFKFPFCERWCDDPKSGVYLNKLVRIGAVYNYPQLIEIKKGCVTQAEHTVYVHGKKSEVTTSV